MRVSKVVSRRVKVAVGMAGLCLLGWAGIATEDRAITWWTVDGGGGTSTGGVYVLMGTIGQPDTGQMSGGRFTLQGGFWAGVLALPDEGAPRLSVTRTNGTIVISWPAPSLGWVLDETPTLSAATLPWTQVPVSRYETNATTLSLTLRLPAASRFYRLRRL